MPPSRLPIPCLVLLLAAAGASADWPTVRGDAGRTGLLRADLRPPFRLAWVRHLEGERLGSAAEPVVAEGKVFVGTHQGNLYALDAGTGQPLWRFQARGAFLHSPAFDDGLVVAAGTGGLDAVDAGTGEPRWTLPTAGGFAASPLVADGTVLIGSRVGEFLAVELATGKLRWRVPLPAPVRQTAAYRDGRVFVTAEDLRVRCLAAETGKVLWTSEPLSGQTARDGYPVVARSGQRTWVIVRTNPVLNMARQIAQDRRLLCRTAGVDDGDWKKLDAWTKSDQARGSPELWAREQTAIADYLREHPEARTFFVLDADTGKETGVAPVLWCGGCQGVGTPPVLMPDGRALVLYRSAYGNWNHGVAPLVALGLLDLHDNRITPLTHKDGRQPPWNTFWGTADESQNFVSASDTLLVVHQSTLSGFDLPSGKLFPIWGERDSWGGFRNLPWARNEWNGPARGGVAVVDSRLYWQTGSRLLCLVAGEQGKPARDESIDGKDVPTHRAPAAAEAEPKQLRQQLGGEVAEVLSRRWAPLYVEPGLAGREFFFADCGEALAALARAYPQLPAELQRRVKDFLAAEWQAHPPYGTGGRYPVQEGERREWFRVPEAALTGPGNDRPPHPFGNCYAVWLYAERCGEWDRVLAAWPQLRAAFEDFERTGWRLDGDRGDLFANRYLSALRAFSRIASRAGDGETAKRADRAAAETEKVLLAWWRRSAARAATPVLPSVKEWDEFIGHGDALFFRVVPHRAKLALFHDLSPEVAGLVRAGAPEAVDAVWHNFETLCPTWHLQGEERQVHYGENFVDPPDFALDGFRALAWLRRAPAGDLAERLDIPCGRADLNHVMKLALVLDAAGEGPP
jgi:outer membrane protein assembly factor BamB